MQAVIRYPCIVVHEKIIDITEAAASLNVLCNFGKALFIQQKFSDEHDHDQTGDLKTIESAFKTGMASIKLI